MKKELYICFPEGKNKVLTMSYDDGQHHDKRLIEIFNKNGIKGTFHLNSGYMHGEPDMSSNERKVVLKEVKEVYAGHEVSCHTVFHPTLTRMPMPQILQQIIEDRKALEAACGYPVRGLSYPNARYNESIERALPACGIEYCRTGRCTGMFEFPENFLRWDPTCHHNDHLMEYAEQFADLSKKQYLYAMYVFGHSFEFYRENTWDIIESFCEYIGGRDDIWYATNIEIVDYMNAAHGLKFSAAGDMVYNPAAISVWISADGDIKKILPGETAAI